MRLDPQGELSVLFSSLDPLQARDPQVDAAVDFFGVDTELLQQQWALLEPTAPLAWDDALYDASRDHSQRMIDFDDQSHNLPGESDLLTRIIDAGYNWTQSIGVGENVFAFAQSTFYGHAGFAIDWGFGDGGLQNPAGHRLNIMDSSFQEIGIGIISDNSTSTDVGPLVITQNFGRRGNHEPKLLGVVFADANGDGMFTAGEGIGGVSIELSGTNGTFLTSTMAAGGYQIHVPAGTYAVRATGEGLVGSVNLGTVAIANENVKVDLNTLDLSADSNITGLLFDGTTYDQDLVGVTSGVEGATVYLDGNNNSQLDAGEPTVLTQAGGLFAL